jgi:NADPH:quinone reductase-like Zn-dependent oxidoreductase
VVDTTFALENLPAAHEYMASDRQVGKIVIVT